MYVSIDPGADTGYAIWRRLRLVACGLGDPRRCSAHIAADIDDVWIEKPVVYPRSKARPADIVKLAVLAGQWGGVYATLGVNVHLVEPAQWKGQVPKEIHHSRVWAALFSEEQDLVSRAVAGVAPSKRHNVLDAVGLGLWACKRAVRAA